MTAAARIGVMGDALPRTSARRATVLSETTRDAVVALAVGVLCFALLSALSHRLFYL